MTPKRTIISGTSLLVFPEQFVDPQEWVIPVYAKVTQVLGDDTYMVETKARGVRRPSVSRRVSAAVSELKQVSGTENSRLNIGSWLRSAVICIYDNKYVYGQVRDYDFKASSLSVKTAVGVLDCTQDNLCVVDGAMAMLLYTSSGVLQVGSTAADVRKSHLTIVERIMGGVSVSTTSDLNEILQGFCAAPSDTCIEWCDPLTGIVANCGLDHVVLFLRYNNQAVPDGVIIGASFCDDPSMRLEQLDDDVARAAIDQLLARGEEEVKGGSDNKEDFLSPNMTFGWSCRPDRCEFNHNHAGSVSVPID